MVSPCGARRARHTPPHLLELARPGEAVQEFAVDVADRQLHFVWEPMAAVEVPPRCVWRWRLGQLGDTVAVNLDVRGCDAVVAGVEPLDANEFWHVHRIGERRIRSPGCGRAPVRASSVREAGGRPLSRVVTSSGRRPAVPRKGTAHMGSQDKHPTASAERGAPVARPGPTPPTTARTTAREVVLDVSTARGHQAQAYRPELIHPRPRPALPGDSARRVGWLDHIGEMLGGKGVDSRTSSWSSSSRTTGSTMTAFGGVLALGRGNGTSTSSPGVSLIRPGGCSCRSRW